MVRQADRAVFGAVLCAAELIPNSVTPVTRYLGGPPTCRTPVVGSRNTSSSAARTHREHQLRDLAGPQARLSSSGTATACPPARPRARIVCYKSARYRASPKRPVLPALVMAVFFSLLD